MQFGESSVEEKMRIYKENDFLIGVFDSTADAEKAYGYALSCGYTDKDITIIMSEESKEKYYATNIMSNNPDTLHDVATGGTAGGAIGGVIGAIIGLGTNILVPGLGLVIAGPLAGIVAGTLMGTLLGLGISESNAQEFEEDLKSGAIILSVKESVPSDLKNQWEQI